MNPPSASSSVLTTASTARTWPSEITVPGNRGVKVTRSCSILRPPQELYEFWRNLENLPRIIKHPVTVTRVAPGKSHWSVSAPFGDHRAEWDAVIINDKPGELIAWRSLEGASVPNAGTVRFEPAADGTGTDVTVQLEYDPPGGKLAAFFAKLTGEEPGQQVAAALLRFRELMEKRGGAGAADTRPGAGSI
jgi:uncharacterized membrane protein